MGDLKLYGGSNITTLPLHLFLYETFKCKVINVEFLSRDLPLNNSAIMV